MEFITVQVDVDRFEIRVLGNQRNMAAFALEALDRDIVAQPGNDDLAVGGFCGCLLYTSDAADEHRDV